MSRKAKYPQSRHHVWVYDHVWDWISRHVAREDLTNGQFVRDLTLAFMLKQEEKIAAARKGEER